MIWQSSKLKDPAAYSSLIPATILGVPQYVTTTGNSIVGIDAKSGNLLWKYSKQGTYKVAVIPTVVVKDNYVFATAGYGAGCDLIEITGSKSSMQAQKIYANKNMVNHHGGVILYKDHIYGYSDGKGWICLDLMKGEIKWSEKTNQKTKGLGKGSITYADGHFYCYGESDGTVVLIEASTEGWNQKGRLELPEKTKLPRKAGQIWTHPTVSNGKLFLRDQDLLFCFDIKNVQ